jgi:hypothetical protein
MSNPILSPLSSPTPLSFSSRDRAKAAVVSSWDRPNTDHPRYPPHPTPTVAARSLATMGSNPTAWSSGPDLMLCAPPHSPTHVPSPSLSLNFDCALLCMSTNSVAYQKIVLTPRGGTTRWPPLAPAASSHTSIHTTPPLIVSLLIIESEVWGAYMEGIDKSEGFVVPDDFCLDYRSNLGLFWWQLWVQEEPSLPHNQTSLSLFFVSNFAISITRFVLWGTF